jgi:hypothetical protein
MRFDVWLILGVLIPDTSTHCLRVSRMNQSSSIFYSKKENHRLPTNNQLPCQPSADRPNVNYVRVQEPTTPPHFLEYDCTPYVVGPTGRQGMPSRYP